MQLQIAPLPILLIQILQSAIISRICCLYCSRGGRQSFSPIIADYERENPLFKEAVKIAITPMISSLSIMENANSESEVLGLGLSVIALNLGMYLGVPAVVVIGIRKKF